MRFLSSMVASLVAAGCDDVVVRCRPISWNGEPCDGAVLKKCPGKSTQRVVVIKRKGCSEDKTAFTVTENQVDGRGKINELNRKNYTLKEVGDAKCNKLAKRSAFSWKGNVRSCVANKKFCYNGRRKEERHKVDREDYVKVEKAGCDVSKSSCLNKLKVQALGSAVAQVGMLAGLGMMVSLDEVDSTAGVPVAPNTIMQEPREQHSIEVDGAAATFHETNIEVVDGEVSTSAPGHETHARDRVLRNR